MARRWCLPDMKNWLPIHQGPGGDKEAGESPPATKPVLRMVTPSWE